MGTFAKEREVGVDAALQHGVFGLAGQRLNPHLQRYAVGHVGHWKGVLRGRLGEIPYQLFIGCTYSGKVKETQTFDCIWIKTERIIRTIYRMDAISDANLSQQRTV